MNDQTKFNTTPSGIPTIASKDSLAKDWHKFYNTLTTLHGSPNLPLLPRYEDLASSDVKALEDTAQAILNRYMVFEKKIPKQKDTTDLDQYLEKMIELFKTKSRPMSTAELGIIHDVDKDRMFRIMRNWSNRGFFTRNDTTININGMFKDGTPLDKIQTITYWSLVDKQ